jgi:hypothetical protein
MKLLQSVVVKQVLSEKSKKELEEKYLSNKLQLQKESDQLRFELKKLEKTAKFKQQTLKNQFEKEIHIRLEKIKLIEFQLEQLHMLPLGSEIKEQEVQAIVDVHIGDNWSSFIQNKTIVIKDDLVIDIR